MDSTGVTGGDRIRLNVGGKIFETTVSTLQSAGPDSLLAALSNRPEPIFIDRDPDVFSVLLSLLRSSRLPSSSRRFTPQELADEALYYGLDSHLRAAMSPPPLSGIDASVVSTVRPAADALPTSFSPGADGSLWLAHGGQISVYDWSLAHAATLRTHLDAVTSLRRVCPDIAAVGSDAAAGVHFYHVAGARHVGSATPMPAPMPDSRLLFLLAAPTPTRRNGNGLYGVGAMEEWGGEGAPRCRWGGEGRLRARVGLRARAQWRAGGEAASDSWRRRWRRRSDFFF